MSAIPRYNSFATGAAVAFNSTAYFQSFSTTSTTESFRQVRYRLPGVMSKFRVVISANTIATSASTVRIRKNTANGNQSVSIGAGATGAFQDASNTDTITAGDLICFQAVTPNTSGTLTVSLAETLFAATTDSAVKFVARNGTLANTATLSFQPLAGSALNQTTEANAQVKTRTAGTFKNLLTNIESNGSSSSTPLKFRKNGADGNQIVTVGLSASGIFEDVTNVDTVAVNDLINCSFLTAPTGTNIAFGLLAAVDFVTTDSSSMIIQSSGPAFNAAVTTYLNFGSDGGPSTTEANKQSLALAPFTASKAACFVTANTVTAGSTVRFRKNGANGNQSVAITASTTGFFEDASNTDTVVATDLVNWQVTTGATGTSLSMVCVYGKIAITAASPFNYSFFLVF